MEANLFNLHGKGVEVHYSTSSISGVPLLSVRGKGAEKNFKGEEIRASQSEIGIQVTVTLEVVPDLRSEELTFILPNTNVEQGVEAAIEAPAIWTTSRTSIGGPALVKGALQSYRVDELKGTAAIVDF